VTLKPEDAENSALNRRNKIHLKIYCHLSEITEFKHTGLIKMIILEENF